MILLTNVMFLHPSLQEGSCSMCQCQTVLNSLL